MNLNLDYNELDLEGMHLREIEDNFRSGLPTFSEREPVWNINLPCKQNIRINVNRPYPSRLIQRNPNQNSSINSVQSKPLGNTSN